MFLLISGMPWQKVLQPSFAWLPGAVHPQAWAAPLADEGIKGGFWVERGRVGGWVLCRQTSGLASAGALEGFPGELRVIQIVDAILPCTGKYISPDFPSPVNNTPASVA